MPRDRFDKTVIGKAERILKKVFFSLFGCFFPKPASQISLPEFGGSGTVGKSFRG
jgi:hypothetical protein